MQCRAEILPQSGRAGDPFKHLPRLSAISPHKAPCPGFGQKIMALAQIGDQVIDTIHREIATGQRHPRRPIAPRLRKEPGQCLQRVFGKSAIGGDLAAEDVEQRRAPFGPQLEHVIPRGLGRRGRAVIIQRAHTRIGPDDVVGGDVLPEIAVGEIQQILLFCRRADGFVVWRAVVLIGGADQREIGLIRDGEDDAPVGALKEISLVMVKQAPRDNVRAAHQAHALGRVHVHAVLQDFADPGAARVDQHLRGDRFGDAGHGVFHRDVPQIAHPAGFGRARAGQDARALVGGIAGIQHHQPRVLDPAIGIFIGMGELVLQRRALGRPAQAQRRRPRQQHAPAKVVIQKQPQTDQPRGPAPAHPWHDPFQDPGNGRFPLEPHVLVIGQHEPHGPADMWHRAQQGFAFPQGFAHQPDLEILQIAQPAVKQLGRRRRGGRGQIVHLGQRHRQPAPGCVPGDAAPVDPATDDEQIAGHCRTGLGGHRGTMA